MYVCICIDLRSIISAKVATKKNKGSFTNIVAESEKYCEI